MNLRYFANANVIYRRRRTVSDSFATGSTAWPA